MYLTIFGGVHLIHTFGQNIIQRVELQDTHYILLYYSLGRGRRRDINYTLKPIFLRAFPFLVIEDDVFGHFIIITANG